MSGVRYGPTRIRYSGDKARGREFLPRAMQLLRRTQERQRLGGLNVLGSQMALADDSYCYVVLAGGMSNLHIIAGYTDREAQPAELVRVARPDFVSGVVKDGHIVTVSAGPGLPDKQTMRAFHPTMACVAQYAPKKGGRNPHVFDPAYQDVDRLAVEPHDSLPGLSNPSDAAMAPLFSQYTRLKPTMYSGMMRRVVQALLGFGRQRVAKGRQISLYEYVEQEVADPGPVTSAEYRRDTAANGLQVRYDWRFARTHGICTAADGQLWLVEIGVNGVLVMPLDFHLATQDPKFRTRLEELGDTDALQLLDAFGGFPTGEPIPSSASIEAWIRAGRVQRLLTREQMDQFYQHNPYSSVMGWAFNLSGTEAHNTAWYMGDDGFQRGVHYAVTMSIGAMQSRGVPGGLAVADRLMALRGDDRVADDWEAVIWKCRRLTENEITHVMRRARTDLDLFRAVNELDLPPVAPASAALRRQGTGHLVHPAKIGNLIKFPEPAIGYLVSHNMNPEKWAVGDRVSDTIVHVFFAGDELKWVRYFRDPRTSPSQHWDDHEQCMYIGTWTSHQEQGSRAMATGLYSNDFDHRMETAPSTTDTVTVGRDLGYSAVTVADDPVRPYLATVSRTKRFSVEVTTTRISGAHVETGVAVPFDDREAYYYAVYRSQDKAVTVAHSFKSLADPWYGTTWRNFPGYTGSWAGDIDTGRWIRLDPHPDGCGPVTARTVRAPGPLYSGGACSDVADSGPWLSTCDDADRKVYSIPTPPTPPSTHTQEPSSGYQVWLVNSTRFGPLMTHEHSGTFQLWPLISPFNGDANVSWDQHIAETANAFGEADSMRYGVNLNAESKVKGRPNWAGMEVGALTYIGVING